MQCTKEYLPCEERYNEMLYRRCGNSGLKLPAVSLGLWHNFGEMTLLDNARAMARRAFDLGITHFDLGNNYGPPPGAAEETFGTILRKDLMRFRDELIISTKAGYDMWPGPYGDWGSRKYLVSSLDQSLKRMGLDYVDIFYHHRPDPETPLEETMGALDHLVRQGKALYVGISNYYMPEEARKAFRILKEMGTPCLLHQISYSMLNRTLEEGLEQVHLDEGVGCITFSPLAGGLLTDRYIEGIPADSRAASESPFLKTEQLNEVLLGKIKKLNNLAGERGQTLAQMALAWNLGHRSVASVLIGASKVRQIEDCVRAAEKTDFTEEEVTRIEEILKN